MLGPRTGQDTSVWDAWGLGSWCPAPQWVLSERGFGVSVHHEGCSGLGKTPWSLFSRGAYSLFRPIPLPTPRVGWDQYGRQALF